MRTGGNDIRRAAQLRSQKTQNDIDRAMEEPTGGIFSIRDALGDVLMRRQEMLRAKGGGGCRCGRFRDRTFRGIRTSDPLACRGLI